MREPVICFNQKSESFTKYMQANFSQMCHWATLSCKSKLCNASRAEKGRAKGAACGLHVGKVSATTWKKPKGYEEVTPFGAQSFKTENSCSKLVSLRLYLSLLWGCQIRCIHCTTTILVSKQPLPHSEVIWHGSTLMQGIPLCPLLQW